MLLCAFVIALITPSGLSTTYTIERISDPAEYSRWPRIAPSDPHAVWVTDDPSSGAHEIDLYKGAGIIRVTDNSKPEYSVNLNGNGYVVWSELSEEAEIFLYDGTTTTRLTYSGDSDNQPRLNGQNRVVWRRSADGAYDATSEIYLYKGIETIRLTNNDYCDVEPRINLWGKIVWSGQPGPDGDHEIFLYDGGTTTRLTDNDYDDRYPRISKEGHVVWQSGSWGRGEVFLYDGTTVQQITDDGRAKGSVSEGTANVNKWGRIVWCASEGGDYEIFLYDDGTITQITDNDFDDTEPRINDSGVITWQGYDGSYNQIFVCSSYDGSNGPTILQLTDNERDDLRPQINNDGCIVWQSSDFSGSPMTAEIFLARPVSTGSSASYPRTTSRGGPFTSIYDDNNLICWWHDLIQFEAPVRPWEEPVTPDGDGPHRKATEEIRHPDGLETPPLHYAERVAALGRSLSRTWNPQKPPRGLFETYRRGYEFITRSRSPQFPPHRTKEVSALLSAFPIGARFTRDMRDSTLKVLGQFAETGENDLYASALLAEAINAVDLDWRLPVLSPRRVAAGRNANADFRGVASVEFDNVTKAGTASLNVLSGRPHMPRDCSRVGRVRPTSSTSTASQPGLPI
jgi:hypothetical protein